MTSWDKHVRQHDIASIEAALRNLENARNILEDLGAEEAADLVTAAIQEIT